MAKKREFPEVIYYTDEHNDEFSTMKIEARRIDGSYPYLHKTVFGNFFHWFLYRLIATPIAWCYLKLKFHHSVKGKRKLKIAKKQGYFIYGNHTQIIGDALMPAFISYPKAAYVIVHPNNVSIPFLGHFTPYMGALPLPDDIEATRHFVEAIEKRLKQKKAIFIYPEAHLWPYCTRIRHFDDRSFHYPVKYNTPVYCFTNTYQKRRNPNKVKITTYIDGPFYPNSSFGPDAAKELRDQVFSAMVERTEENEIALVRYVKKDD